MNHALLFSVFIVASCGLAYELIAGALASYLLGDSVTQFSTVIGTYLFAMGIGSWLSRYVERHLVARFIQVELMVGVLGGFSAAALFFLFVWSPAPFKLALYLAVAGVGVLVGELAQPGSSSTEVGGKRVVHEAPIDHQVESVGEVVVGAVSHHTPPAGS